jgi:prolipoprotein diacylglyceryltransferase
MPTRWLDLLARPEIRVAHHPVSAFHVCGSVGLLLGVGLGVALTSHRDLSLGVLAAIVLIAVATFLALATITKIVLREEQLIYYHHEVAILGTVTVLLALLGEPVLPYLDVTILGVGTFLFCGRVGCFMVGCCHGRPCRRGVRYRAEHAEAGFTPYYVGVRLFPIQLVESAWVLATVAVGVWLVLGGAVPGAALAWYVIVYDVGRFCLEFGRGDPARPYRAGFSEGQWTSLLLMLVVVGAELAGAMPVHLWHLAATGLVITAMVAVAIRRDTRYRLLNPNHVKELADGLDLLGTRARDGRHVDLVSTSTGLRFSAGQLETDDGPVHHYALSTSDGTLSESDARTVAGLIGLVHHHEVPGKVWPGRAGVFHVLVPSQRDGQHEAVVT